MDELSFTKPSVQLTGTDGNVYALMGRCSRALKQAGLADKAEEMVERINKEAEDYDHALRIMMEYVDAS